MGDDDDPDDDDDLDDDESVWKSDLGSPEPSETDSLGGSERLGAGR